MDRDSMKIAIFGIVFGTALIVVLASSLRRWYMFRGWHSWPVAEATIETAEVRVYRGRCFAKTAYSYAINGSFQAGWDERAFSCEAEAEAYAASIRGQKVNIRVSPENPERSCIDEASVVLS